MKDAILQRERLWSLDVVRGLATCLVLLIHLPPTDRKGATPIEPIVQWLHEIGWIGVDLFFVLSGVLISSLIFREYDSTSSFRPVRFLVRRSFKIWPTYFIAYGGVTVLRLCVAFSRNDQESIGLILTGAFWSSVFLQNYWRVEPWQHSWSIAIEEHFYTALAALIAVSCARKSRVDGKQRFRFVLPLWGVSAFLALWSRWTVSFPSPNWHAAYYPTHQRVDALLFGVLLGYGIWYYPEKIKAKITEWKPFIFLSAICAFTWPTIWPLHTSSWICFVGFPLLYLSFAPVVAFAAMTVGVGKENYPFRILNGLAWVGEFSYTIYIAHSILFMIPGVERVRQFGLGVLSPLGNECCLWADRVGFWLASIALGVLLSFLIERPFLRLRSRFVP